MSDADTWAAMSRQDRLSLRADLQALANRHPEYYDAASDVARDIGFVMDKPDNWYIHDGAKVMLFREGDNNQIPQVRVELERSGADLVVRSVYVGDRRQIAKKMADKRKLLGGIGLGGQSLDSLSVADYLAALGDRSSRPESSSDNSPDARADVIPRGEDGQPAFSRSVAQGGPAQRAGDAIKAVSATNLKQRADWKATDYLGLGLQTLGRRQIVDIYGDALPLEQYNKLAAQMEADKNEVGANADKLTAAWGKLKDERQLAELMHDATLAQMDPAKDHVPGDDQMRYKMLRARFNALTPGAKQVYLDARGAYQAHHANVRQAIKDRIERSELKGERKAALLKQMDDEFYKAVKGVYFPLARFGQYVVVVKDADGKVASVNRAETMAEAQALRGSLLKAFPAGSGHTVARPILGKEFIAGSPRR